MVSSEELPVKEDAQMLSHSLPPPPPPNILDVMVALVGTRGFQKHW